MLSLFSTFEKASGQQINTVKSSVVFSKNADAYLKEDICHFLRFKEEGNYCLYLGLLNIIGRNKRALFGFLKEKLHEPI